jgi:hypothetical protein
VRSVRPGEVGLNVDFPPRPPRPTAGDVLRPIWLESDVPPFPSPSPQPQAIYWDAIRRIDVAFLPDTDWGTDLHAFSDSAGEIAGHLLFEPLYNNAVPPVVARYFEARQQFSYWAGPAGADAEFPAGGWCTLNATGWVPAALAFTDGQAILHRLRFQDCSVGGPGWATVTASPNAITTYVHESGHFLFCMGDEYQGAERVACSDPPNTIKTQIACLQTAAAFNYPSNWCVRIANSALWRITNWSAEIMAMTLPNYTADWRDTNDYLVRQRIRACVLGACW